MPDPESIFGGSLGVLFGEVPLSYSVEEGDSLDVWIPVPSLSAGLKSGNTAEIKKLTLRLANDESGKTGLMAHYLWNASVVLSRLVGFASLAINERNEEREKWTPFRIDGINSVLELGSAHGLLGISTCCCSQARGVLTDFPTDEILRTLEMNVAKNGLDSRIAVAGHEWGTKEMRTRKGETVDGSFDLVLLADTVYSLAAVPMLAESVDRFSRPGSRALLAFGLHTGPEPPRRFLELMRDSGWMVKRVAVVRVTGDLLEPPELSSDSRLDGLSSDRLLPNMDILFPDGTHNFEEWGWLVPASSSEEEKVRLKKGTVVIYHLVREG